MKAAPIVDVQEQMFAPRANAHDGPPFERALDVRMLADETQNPSPRERRPQTARETVNRVAFGHPRIMRPRHGSVTATRRRAPRPGPGDLIDVPLPRADGPGHTHCSTFTILTILAG